MKITVSNSTEQGSILSSLGDGAFVSSDGKTPYLANGGQVGYVDAYGNWTITRQSSFTATRVTPYKGKITLEV